VRLALAVGREACEHGQHDPRTLATVFTSSSGDGWNAVSTLRRSTVSAGFSRSRSRTL